MTRVTGISRARRGTIRLRCLKLKTPWKRVRLSLGRGAAGCSAHRFDSRENEAAETVHSDGFETLPDCG
jgi:hypothetical protein